MGLKNNRFQLAWTSTNPVPWIQVPGMGNNSVNPPNTATAGAMASTNTIYSSVQDIRNSNDQGLEISWTGTPTGVLTISCSISGAIFYPITFSPALTQPAGGSGGYLVDLTQLPWTYVLVTYTNTSGTGTLTTWIQSKDLS